MKHSLLVFLLFITARSSFAQNHVSTLADSLAIARQETKDYLKLKNTAISFGLVSYGLLKNEIKPIRKFDLSTRNEMMEDHPGVVHTYDNYLQYAPTVSLFMFDAMGLKTAHKVKQQVALHLMSTVIMTATVHSLKHISSDMRPDGSAANSFPSGHTATAFASAEILHQELKDAHPIISCTGYLFATATGIMRVYNNRHWVSDVVAGAGIGILSTKASYWLFNKIKNRRHTATATF